MCPTTSVSVFSKQAHPGLEVLRGGSGVPTVWLPGGDGAGLEDQATRGLSPLGRQVEFGCRDVANGPRARAGAPPSPDISPEVGCAVPCAPRVGDGSFYQGAARRGLPALPCTSGFRELDAALSAPPLPRYGSIPALGYLAKSRRIRTNVPKHRVNAHMVCRTPKCGSFLEFTGANMAVMNPRWVPSAL